MTLRERAMARRTDRKKKTAGIRVFSGRANKTNVEKKTYVIKLHRRAADDAGVAQYTVQKVRVRAYS